MKQKKQFFKRTVGIILSIVFTLCSLQVSQSTNAASKLKINKTKAEVYVGKTVQLKVTGTKNKITWTSNNKKIATVTTKGKVKGIKKGTATITAKVSKKKLTCKVTVKEKDTVIPTNTPNVETVPTEKPVVTQSPIVEHTVVPTSTITPTVEPTVIHTVIPTSYPVATPTEKPHIKYIGNYKVQFNETKGVYQVLFSLFLEDKETAVKSSGIANIEIINSNQENIYNQNIKFTENDFDVWGNAFSESLKCCVEIPVSSINTGSSSDGKLYLRIELDNREGFPKKDFDIKNLPKIDMLKTNVNTLKSYILQNGLVGENGNKFIFSIYPIEEVNGSYTKIIEYNSENDNFKFSFITEYEKEVIGGTEMTINPLSSNEANVESNYSFSSNYIQAKSNFDISKYTKKYTLSFYYFKYSKNYKRDFAEFLANDTIRSSIESWEELLYDKTGLKLKDIGFTSY